MPQCPSCGSPLDQDFGMVTCADCGAVLMININGQVVVGEDALTHSENTNTAPSNLGWDQDLEPPESEEEFGEFDEFQAGPINDLREDSVEDSFEDSDAQSSLADNDLLEDVDRESKHAQVNTAFFEVDEALGSNEEQQEVSDDEDLGIASAPDKKPLDLTEFANSEASSLESGEFLYQLTISGLDSKDLRDVLKGVLMDEKLKLNYNGILKQISQGRVKIVGLNPVKAKRIVEQLQYFDLKVKWRQSRVTVEPQAQADLEEATGDL